MQCQKIDRYSLSLLNIHAGYINVAWSMLYCSLVLPELDKFQTIKELLRVKTGLISLQLLTRCLSG